MLVSVKDIPAPAIPYVGINIITEGIVIAKPTREAIILCFGLLTPEK